MTYQVDFKTSARRSFQALPLSARQRIGEAITFLSTNPRPSGVKKLSNTESLYRIRVGDYRVIYEIEDTILHILIVKVGPRSDVYR